MKKTKKQIRILSDNTVIPLDNIEKLSKCLALNAVKVLKNIHFILFKK